MHTYVANFCIFTAIKIDSTKKKVSLNIQTPNVKINRASSWAVHMAPAGV